MKKIIFFTAFTLLLNIMLFAQSKDAAIVARKGIIGRTMKSDYSKLNDGALYKIYATYIGQIKQKNGRVLKFINQYSKWGPNNHGTAWIYLYNNDNQYIGHYHVGDRNDLPIKVKNGNLVFIKQSESCNQSTKINFYNRLPKMIFIKCKGDMGDLYSFTTDE